jgi:heat shock protein HslJ
LHSVSIAGSGDVVNREESISGFEAIDVSHAFEVDITKDELLYRRRRPPILAVIFTLLILALAACGGSGASALRDTAWRLESLTGNEVFAGTTITLEFSDDQVSGSAGCNHYGGSYQAGGKSLSVRDVFATEMGCLEPEGILEQERVYLAALRAAATYQISADRLEIFDAAGTQVLLFVAQ